MIEDDYQYYEPDNEPDESEDNSKDTAENLVEVRMTLTNITQQFTILEKDGNFGVLSLLTGNEGAMTGLYDSRTKTRANRFFEKSKDAIQQHTKDIQTSVYRHWNVLWQGQPNFG